MTTSQPETGSTPHSVEPQVEAIEPSGHDGSETLDLNQSEGSCLLPTATEISMDVGLTVEKPTGGDTEMLGDDDDDTTDD